MRQHQPGQRRAFALMLALALVSIMFMLCTAFLSRSESALGSSSHIAAELKAFYLAEAGIRYYLTLGDAWNVARNESFSLSTGTFSVRVALNGDQVMVRSQGDTGRAKRTIVLNLNKDGAVERRYEE